MIDEIGQIRIVKVNTETYLLSECSCPFWLKNLICKHVLLVCFTKKLCTFPALEKEIESNAKRGRKRNYVCGLTPAEYIQYNDQLFPSKELALPVDELNNTSVNETTNTSASTSSSSRTTRSSVLARAAAISPKKNIDDDDMLQSNKRCIIVMGVAKKRRGRPAKEKTTN